jgi:hypothetical protein
VPLFVQGVIGTSSGVRETPLKRGFEDLPTGDEAGPQPGAQPAGAVKSRLAK